MSKEYWDCHLHRDQLKVSIANTIYHPEHGQLCWCDSKWDGVLYFPIRFNDQHEARKWINSGYIADLQEGLGCLGVGFSKDCFKAREAIT